MSGILRIATIGDLHLNHRKNSVDVTISALNKYVTNERVFRTIDYLFIEGDVFDTLMDVSDPKLPSILRWVNRALYLAAKHNVGVRVLEGTGLHDRKQSHIFVSTGVNLEKMGLHVDIKYISTVSVETLPCGKVIAYVPDEMGPPDATVHILKTELSKLGIEKADLALMHGAFKYQLPMIDHPMSHDEQIYRELINGPVFIGHIHTYTTKYNIIATGSFDRCRQDEEEAKGYTITEVNLGDGSFTTEFIENKLAHRYVGIHISSFELADVFIEIANKLSKLNLPDGANVCVYTTKGSLIPSNMVLLRDRYPFYHWDFIIKDVKKENTDANKVAMFTKRQYTPLVLNGETLPTLTAQRLKDIGSDPSILKRCMGLLSECL